MWRDSDGRMDGRIEGMDGWDDDPVSVSQCTLACVCVCKCVLCVV